MRRFIALLLILAPLSVFSLGCGGEKPPKRDPNWKTSDNPSDIVVPGSMKKGIPPKGAPSK
jgi:hypothetical protein